MQGIDVLGDQGDRAGIVALQPGDGAMCGIGGDLGGTLAAGVVEGVDQGRIAGESFRRGDILDPPVFPQAPRAPEGAHAAFGGNARAGQNDDVFHG